MPATIIHNGFQRYHDNHSHHHHNTIITSRQFQQSAATSGEQAPERTFPPTTEPSKILVNAAKPRLHRISFQTWHRWINISVMDSPDQPITSDRPAGFLRTSWFDGTSMDLHATCDKTSPILAHCHPSFWGNRLILSFGDHKASPETVYRAELVEQRFWRMEWAISVVVAGSSTPRTFTWRRTNRVGICGRPLKSWSSKNFKLVDEEDKVVAVFNRSGLPWHTAAKLEVIPDLGKTFEHMVWMSIIGYFAMVQARDAWFATAAAW